MGALVTQYLKQSGLALGLNVQCVFKAWDEVSNAGKYTVKRFFRDGVLHISLNSSVVKSQLQFQLPQILEKMNKQLAADELYSGEAIKEIKLK